MRRLAVLVLACHYRLAASHAPATTTPARWHLKRRAAILSAHPEVAQLASPETRTLPMLAVTNVAQTAACVACAHLPVPALIPIAIYLGGTLSLWQFALLHDIKHGAAELPAKTSVNSVLFAGSLPSLFGYYLYLRYGHLSHHKNFGVRPLRDLFDSEQATFEDGDALFVAHRQSMTGDAPRARVGFAGKEDVGGLGISISRTIYSLLWVDLGPDASGRDAEAVDVNTPLLARAAGWARRVVPLWNACAYAFSMTFERAALVFGGSIVVALTGNNAFFPYKPPPFHETAAR